MIFAMKREKKQLKKRKDESGKILRRYEENKFNRQYNLNSKESNR